MKSQGPADPRHPTPSLATPTLVADQVYETLRTRILAGELAAGSPLRVRDVAQWVGTSVMPVREAIRRLEETGLAVRYPHRGAVVKEFTVAELIHVYDVRTILESQAARRGAKSATDEALAEMRAALDRMQAAVQRGRAATALDEDETIHRTLYLAAGNPVLVSTIDALWLRCRPYKVLGANAALEAHDASLWSTQAEIVEATERREVKAVVDIVRDSLASARKRLVAQLQ